jgi:hypothetical protein
MKMSAGFEDAFTSLKKMVGRPELITCCSVARVDARLDDRTEEEYCFKPP